MTLFQDGIIAPGDRRRGSESHRVLFKQQGNNGTWRTTIPVPASRLRHDGLEQRPPMRAMPAELSASGATTARPCRDHRLAGAGG